MTVSPTTIPQILQRALQNQVARNFPMAEALYRQVLARQARNADALHYLGLILHSKKDDASKQEGLKLVEKSLKIMPGNQNFINNLSTLYIEAADWNTALKICTQVISARPTFAGGHHNLGCVYRGLEQYAQADTCFLTALKFAPQNANTHANLGVVYALQGRLVEAGAKFAEAFNIDENCYDALAGMGQLLMTSSQFEESRICLERAIAQRPTIATNYSNLGFTLAMQAKYSEALQTLLGGLAIDKDNYSCQARLIMVYGFLSRYKDADATFSALRALGTTPPSLFSSYLFVKLYDPTVTAEALFELHTEFGQMIEAPYRASWPTFIRDTAPNRRLKIGYVSGDFYDHPVANFVLPTLQNHDRAKYEIHCYSTYGVIDDTTKAIIKAANFWHSTAELSGEEIRDKIRADNLDILIDLSGHTARNILGLLAQRLAPIQMTWIGYPGTTGLNAMDYRITDANLDPVGVTDKFHTEKLLRHPTTNVSFRPVSNCPTVNELPALTNGFITFACLNLSKKINAAVVACWAPILLGLPTAKLILCDTGDDLVAQRITDMFAAHGVLKNQIQTKARMPLLDFLALHTEIDLALDPFPYNGGTTNQYALWMGVPMITLPGQTTVSNVGAAALRPRKLDEFIASSVIDYAQKAIWYANNLEHLASIRASLGRRDQANLAVTDTEITRGIETLFDGAWQKWCEENRNQQTVGLQQ